MNTGKPKALILSQGCSANFGDGEKIARILSSSYDVSFEMPDWDLSLPKGIRPEDSPDENSPKAIYLNVCTVKGNASAMKLLKKVRVAFPSTSIFITGCAPPDFKEEALREAPQVIFTSLHDLEKQFHEKNVPGFSPCSAGTLRENTHIGIANIEEGCLDACAFCSTHLVKGRLHSFSPDSIVEQVKRLVGDGCSEIQLSGQDCACYGFDIGTNLAELVQRILVKVEGNYRIRLGMGNPRHVLQYEDALLDCFTDDHLYKFIHIPVQSGSDSVLQFMKRQHSAEDYRRLARSFTERFEGFTLSTDLIVGFPGETHEDFSQTLEILKETRPTICNITRFVPRPGTLADRLESGAVSGTEIKPVPDGVKHQRSATLFQAFQQIALENNREWIGRECTVITEKSGHRAGTTIARNEAYRPVALQGNIDAGQRIRVSITGAEPFALIGTPINH